MLDERDRYWPRRVEEIEGSGVSLINEPLPPDNVRSIVRAERRSLVLIESLNSTQALLARLEAGVHVPCDQQREVVRSLYVATRNQARALIATLELQGLE